MPDLPSSTPILEGIKNWSNPLFQDLLPYAYLAMGVVIGTGLIIFLIYIASLLYKYLSGQAHKG